MARFDDGILSYVEGVAIVRTYFPVDKKGAAEIACKHCNYFVRATLRCGLTQTIVNYPERHVGSECPLVPAEEFKETLKEQENV